MAALAEKVAALKVSEGEAAAADAECGECSELSVSVETEGTCGIDISQPVGT